MKSALEIIPVSTLDQVLANALAGPLTPIEWTEEDEAAVPVKAATPDDIDGEAVITH